MIVVDIVIFHCKDKASPFSIFGCFWAKIDHDPASDIFALSVTCWQFWSTFFFQIVNWYELINLLWHQTGNSKWSRCLCSQFWLFVSMQTTMKFATNSNAERCLIWTGTGPCIAVSQRSVVQVRVESKLNCMLLNISLSNTVPLATVLCLCLISKGHTQKCAHTPILLHSANIVQKTRSCLTPLPQPTPQCGHATTWRSATINVVCEQQHAHNGHLKFYQDGQVIQRSLPSLQEWKLSELARGSMIAHASAISLQDTTIWTTAISNFKKSMLLISASEKRVDLAKNCTPMGLAESARKGSSNATMAMSGALKPHAIPRSVRSSLFWEIFFSHSVVTRETQISKHASLYSQQQQMELHSTRQLLLNFHKLIHTLIVSVKCCLKARDDFILQALQNCCSSSQSACTQKKTTRIVSAMTRVKKKILAEKIRLVFGVQRALFCSKFRRLNSVISVFFFFFVEKANIWLHWKNLPK